MKVRLIGTLVGAGVAAWFVRLLAHAKRPAPEGRWREIDLDEHR